MKVTLISYTGNLKEEKKSIVKVNFFSIKTLVSVDLLLITFSSVIYDNCTEGFLTKVNRTCSGLRINHC